MTTQEKPIAPSKFRPAIHPMFGRSLVPFLYGMAMPRGPDFGITRRQHRWRLDRSANQELTLRPQVCAWRASTVASNATFDCSNVCAMRLCRPLEKSTALVTRSASVALIEVDVFPV